MMAPDAVAGLFRQEAVSECHRQMLFRDLIEAKRTADRTDTFSDHRYAAKAYRRFLRAYLTEPEQEVLRLEDEIVRLSAENRMLRGRLHG